MAAALKRFVYTPLQAGEIRLLYPEIVSETEQRWSVKVVSLKDQHGQRTRLEYDALSYTWGDQTDRFPITLNGREIEIGHSLSFMKSCHIWLVATLSCPSGLMGYA